MRLSLLHLQQLFVSLILCTVVLTACNWKHKHKTYTKPQVHLNPSQLLGEKLFFDTGMSNPPGQSCATCHVPAQGFTDPDGLPVSHGAIKSRLGTRNAPTITYASYTPYFHYDSAAVSYMGGLFWDGRAPTLSDQAEQPMLNHSEMNNMSKKMVVDHVKQSNLKDLFLQVYGPHALDDSDKAFSYIAQAIEEYEETPMFSPFTSKFDYYLKGEAKLTASELRGLKLFNDTAKGNCAACHPSTPDPRTGAILFTDFTYDNIGIPANPELVKLNKEYTTDLGLGAILHQASENGKFKVPTLRNIAITAPYFHNGFSKTLEDVLNFYNSRDKGTFGKPEVPETVNHEELGNLGLTKQEMDDIVAFLKTLTDGYQPEHAKR